jgi:hypothetical protein
MCIRKKESEIIYDECYQLLDKVVIERDAFDVTKEYINDFINLYGTETYDSITNFLIENNLSISVVIDSKARSYTAHTLKKVITKSASKTYTDGDGNKKN